MGKPGVTARFFSGRPVCRYPELDPHQGSKQSPSGMDCLGHLLEFANMAKLCDSSLGTGEDRHSRTLVPDDGIALFLKQSGNSV